MSLSGSCRAAGFSLLEVLVSLFLFSVGLLGLVALQITSIKNSHSAGHRAQANLLAYDIADRMRANPGAASSGDYDLEFEEDPTEDASAASEDLAAWRGSLATMLPAGSGQIDTEAVDGSTAVTIEVRWDDSRGTAGAESQSWVMRTEL
jgi:type IV pilus assembly protein PilV